MQYMYCANCGVGFERKYKRTSGNNFCCKECKNAYQVQVGYSKKPKPPNPENFLPALQAAKGKFQDAVTPREGWFRLARPLAFSPSGSSADWAAKPGKESGKEDRQYTVPPELQPVPLRCLGQI